jgi:hypothetical protein
MSSRYSDNYECVEETFNLSSIDYILNGTYHIFLAKASGHIFENYPYYSKFEWKILQVFTEYYFRLQIIIIFYLLHSTILVWNNDCHCVIDGSVFTFPWRRILAWYLNKCCEILMLKSQSRHGICASNQCSV